MPDNNVALTVEGKLISVLPKQEGEGRNGRWQRQSFVIEIQRGSYPTPICFDVWGDQVNTVASLQIGDWLVVSFDPSSREFNGRWYTSLRAWRITVGAGSGVVDRPSTIGTVDQQPAQSSIDPTTDYVPRVDTTPSYQSENDTLTGQGEDLPF